MQLDLRSSLPRVRYSFTCEACPDRAWELRRVTLREQLSQPYRVDLELLVAPGELDLDALLAASCELLVDREAEVRTICGVIDRVALHDPIEDAQVVHLRVVPALRLLAQRVDTRLWQDTSALAVVEQVLREALGEYDRELDTSHLQGSYANRPYIVQYHESDLDFVARLLEDEGIAYRFDHERGSGREVLVLEDSADHWDPLPTLDGEPALPLIVARHDQAEVESVQSLRWQRALRPTAVSRQTFDWLTPMEPVLIREDADPDHGAVGPARELYHHGGPVEDPPEPRVVRELALARAGSRELRGVSNAVGLAPGRRFVLDASARPELDGLELLVVAVEAHGDCPEAQLGASGGDEQYRNEFRCVVLDTEPWRPPLRAPTPRIHGPQTAIVTGPEGEEIHTDEHGRVKVRFAWDRDHGLRDDTSMWIRVAHGWAGAGFGALFVPRIGMEVVVEFIAGDPARPLVTGCVYNGEAAASVALPDAKTQSTIRTRSSPGGDGFNELRFEDAAGSEEIFVHAQRNLREVVGADHTATIGGSRTETIKKDCVVTVEGDHELNVHGLRKEVITKDADVKFNASRKVWVEGSDDVTVVGESTHTFYAGAKRVVVGEDRTEVNRGRAVTLAEGDIEATSSAGSVSVTGAAAVLVSQSPGPDVCGSNQLELANGDATLTSATFKTSSNFAEVNAQVKLSLLSSSEIEAKARTINLDGTAAIGLNAKSIELVAEDSITLKIAGGVATLTLSASGIELNGSMVKIN